MWTGYPPPYIIELRRVASQSGFVCWRCVGSGVGMGGGGGGGGGGSGG